ncbi:DUF6895 family protein [Streptomyces sp. NPDC058045]|uniref:DUF6895 family protein n=1 Tax=Streptomyces sp. NPDC058045 TaxID=3346311 RepID=UPI0036EE5DDC
MTPPAIRPAAESALAWVEAHREDFALDTGALHGGDVNRTWKPLGELAQVCVCVRRHTAAGDPLHRAASALLEHAWRQTRDGALFEELLRLEPFATYPLEVYAAFAAEGMRHQGFERLARTLLATRCWQVTEQEPNRRLGILNSERRSGFSPHAPSAPALRRTWLGGLPEPWTFERGAGYTLTHVVFHLTDWGRTPHTVPEDVARYLDLWLWPWLDGCLEDEQWDLACELLAVAASLPRPPGPGLLRQAWPLLAAAQDPEGGLPEVGAGLAGRTVRRDFTTCYHSTLMVVLAAALTLHRVERRTGPPAAAAPRAGSRGEVT